ncbi:MAG: hypothetical protein J7501_00730, partial [Bdellovibrio sp.]|nr:hypothetical protein [Bdellovibrio sp.]
MKLIFELVIVLATSSFAFANTVRIGSGGDSQQGDFVTDELLVSTLKKITTDEQLLIHSWLWHKEQSPISASELDQLLEVVRSTPVHIVRDVPCKAALEDKDAVAFRSPDSICVSILKLKTKLHFDNYKSQLLGLMLHEHSHLIGFSEEKASFFQQAVIRFVAINGYPPATLPVVLTIFERSSNTIFKAPWNNKTHLYQATQEFVADTKAHVMNFKQMLLYGLYPALPPKEDSTDDILLRLNYLTLVSRAYWAPKKNAAAQKQLDLIFAGRDTVKASAFNATLDFQVQSLQSGDAELKRLTEDSPKADFDALLFDITRQIGSLKFHLTMVYL